MITDYSKKNPDRSTGIWCAKCGGAMIFNVPRLGPDGGFVHNHNRSLVCGVVGKDNTVDKASKSEPITTESLNASVDIEALKSRLENYEKNVPILLDAINEILTSEGGPKWIEATGLIQPEIQWRIDEFKSAIKTKNQK